ncbi:MAG TPA: hypothetical protein VKX49_29125 [Bryobacteraceae bacterium]|nr:hypothetical protein [Bryobacteraceae bacterium]
MIETALVTFLIATQGATQPAKVYHAEREQVAKGAELITVFGRTRSVDPGAAVQDIPLVSVLRDTLGSPNAASTRLRYVWVLTSTRPTLVQRTASALSFFWFRPGGKKHADGVPAPVMDLASPAKSVWSHLAADGIQALQLDGLGAPVRSSTRSYRGNFSDYRELQISRALAALESLDNSRETLAGWPVPELRNVYSRLSLSDRTLGGLVREQNLPKFFDKETSRRAEIRAHNWELLRQRAEENGLYFEPLALPGESATEVMLWVNRGDLDDGGGRNFDRQFLGIANPWSDERLLHWKGYSEIRYLDAENRPVSAATAGAREVELIPLALYSLDYPRVPLLLVDFRSSMTAKRRELVQHGFSAVLAGFLGVTSFGNWSFLAANSAWTFVRGRHGAPTDRSERLRSYSEARQFLAVDSGIAPPLKTELLRRLDQLALDPLENGLDTEARVAKEQFAALMQYSQAPDGLAAKLERDRQKELEAYERSHAARWLTGVGRFMGVGRGRPENPALVSELEARREAAAQVLYLKQALSSSPRPDVVQDPAAIREAVTALAREPFRVHGASKLIAEVLERSEAFDIRMACLAALRRLDVQQARNELDRLSQDPKESGFWRAATVALFPDNRERPAGTASGQF